MNVHVIHHNDLDGFCSAWVFHRKYPDANFYMLGNYDDAPQLPWESNTDKVYIVDLSFDRETMEEYNSFFSVKLLDHHKSAQDELGDLPYCHFELDKCGARLAWEHCFPGEPAHWLVEYTEDQDLWKWQLPDSKEIVAALHSYKFDFNLWEEIANKTPADLKKEGDFIVGYHDDLLEDHLKRVELVTFKGHENVPVVYCDIPAIYSQLGAAMVNNFSKAPFSVTWRVKSGNRCYSLRSKEGRLDVSEIAKKFGGGGHRNASGFSERM